MMDFKHLLNKYVEITNKKIENSPENRLLITEISS